MLPRKLSQFGLLFSARIAGAASLFAVNLLIVRYLGIEALGTYATFVSLASVVAVLVSGGFSAVAPVLVAEYAKKRQPELQKGFVLTAIKQGLIFSAILASGLLLLVSLGTAVPFVHDIELGVAALATAIAIAALGFHGAVLVGLKKQVTGLLPETFVRPLLFLAITGIVLGSGLVTSINQTLWLMAGSAWLAYAFLFVRSRSERAEASELQARFDKTRWSHASRPWMGISLVSDFMIDIVLLLSSLLAGSVEIAILHICFRYRVLAGFGMRTIHTLLMPEITERAIEKNRVGLEAKLLQVNGFSLLYALGAMVLFTSCSGILFGIFSIDAAVALPVLLTVSATMIVRAVFGPAALVLAIHDIHMTTLKVSLVVTVCAMTLIWFVYPYLGIMAASLGYTGANTVIFLLLWRAARKKTGIDCSIFPAIANGLKVRNFRRAFRSVFREAY